MIRLAVAAWTLRLLYLPVELLVAAGAVGYSLRDDTVSDLGALTCRADGTRSPHHLAMNAAFVVAGLLLVLGAGALHGQFHHGDAVRARLLTAALVVTGLGSVATGFVPIDQQPSLHYAVAAPIFVAQPVALVLLAAALRRRAMVHVGAVVLAAAVAAAVGAVGFVVLGEGAAGRGAWERAALWPAFVAFALAAVAPLTDGAGGRAAAGGRARRPRRASPRP